MRRWTVRILIGLATLIVLVAVAVQLVLWSQLPKNLILPQVEKQLGLEIKAGRMTTGWLGYTTLSDVSVSLPLAQKAFLNVPTLKLKENSVFALALTQALGLNDIEIDRPTVVVLQNADGSWNLQEVAELLGKIGGGKEGSDSSASGGVPKLPNVRLLDGTVKVLDNQHHTTQLSPLSVNGYAAGPLVWNYEVAIAQSVSLQGKVAPGGNWQHVLKLQAHHLEALTGNFAVPTYGADLAATWSGQLDGGNVAGTLSIDHATAASTPAGDLHAQRGDRCCRRGAGGDGQPAVARRADHAVGVAGDQGGRRGDPVRRDGAPRERAAGGRPRRGGAGERQRRSEHAHRQPGHALVGTGADQRHQPQRVVAGIVEVADQGASGNQRAAEQPREHLGQPLGRAAEPRRARRKLEEHRLDPHRPAAELHGSQTVQFTDLVGHVMQRYPSVQLTSLTQPQRPHLTSSGQIDLSTRDWFLKLNTGGTPSVKGEPVPIDFSLDASGTRTKSTLNQLELQVSDTDLTANGFYDREQPASPVSLDVSLMQSPSLPPDSPIQGHVRGSAHLSGKLFDQANHFNSDVTLSGDLRSQDLVVLNHRSATPPSTCRGRSITSTITASTAPSSTCSRGGGSCWPTGR